MSKRLTVKTRLIVFCSTIYLSCNLIGFLLGFSLGFDEDLGPGFMSGFVVVGMVQAWIIFVALFSLLVWKGLDWVYNGRKE